jgi:uncharacterized membrane protein YhaH (DUF805 family)
MQNQRLTPQLRIYTGGRMTKSLRLASIALLSQAYVGAHQQSGDDAAAAAAGMLGCLGCGTFALIPLILLVVQIALLVWVARDSKSRGMDGAVVWMIFVFLVPIIGLVVYWFSRPQGNLTKCPSCGNTRLEAAAKCPHCGN